MFKFSLSFVIVASIMLAITTTGGSQDHVKFCDKYVLIAEQMNKTYSISEYMKENGVEGVLETNHCKKEGQI